MLCQQSTLRKEWRVMSKHIWTLLTIVAWLVFVIELTLAITHG